MALPGGQGDGRALQQRALTCIECGAEATGHADGYKAYLADDSEILVYCAACAEREFGDDPSEPLAP